MFLRYVPHFIRDKTQILKNIRLVKDKVEQNANEAHLDLCKVVYISLSKTKVDGP